MRRRKLQAAKCGDLKRRTAATPLMAIRKLHLYFQLVPTLMTLNDLELLYVRIFVEFRVISQIGSHQRLNE